MGLRQWQTVCLNGRQASTRSSHWEKDRRKYAQDVIDCRSMLSYEGLYGRRTLP